MVLKTLSTLRLSEDQPVPGGCLGACVLAGRAARPPLSPFLSQVELLPKAIRKDLKLRGGGGGGVPGVALSPLGGWEIMCRG